MMCSSDLAFSCVCFPSAAFAHRKARDGIPRPGRKGDPTGFAREGRGRVRRSVLHDRQGDFRPFFLCLAFPSVASEIAEGGVRVCDAQYRIPAWRCCGSLLTVLRSGTMLLQHDAVAIFGAPHGTETERTLSTPERGGRVREDAVWRPRHDPTDLRVRGPGGGGGQGR
eukprot:1657148-Rhodomonas_salina.4